MPVYAYECNQCGVRFERRQSFNDDPITECPECDGTVRRLIQPAGVIFKGPGFYSTDNRKSRSSSGGSSSSTTTSESSSATSTAKETSKSAAD
jgi:putative FmdB family regulatory protein